MDITVTQHFIKVLNELPDESVLDHEEFAPLYEYFEDAGMSLLLSTPDDYSLIYFDIPEAIEEILPGNVSWMLEREEKSTALTMFANGSQMQIYHTFHFADNPVNAFFFSNIKESRILSINFLSMVYGDIIKIKSIAFTLPQAILQQL